MIKYQIITSTDIDTREKEDDAALQDIQEFVNRHHPWLYLDGQPTNTDNLTIDALKNAQSITLTHTILGG